MPAAAPAIIGAAASYGAGAALGAGVITGINGAFVLGTGALTGAGLAVTAVAGAVGSALAGAVFAPKAPDISSALDQPGAARTQQFRQPTAAHDVVFGRIKKSGPSAFIHSAEDDEGRADGFFYHQLTLASHRVKSIGDVYLNDELASAEKFVGYQQIGKNLGTADQVEDADFLADLGPGLFGNHWLRGRANIAVRIKVKPEPFPNGLPNISAIVDGCDEIYDPR